MNRYVLLFLLFFLLALVFDFLNWDSVIHLSLCKFLWFTKCPEYYDLKFWDMATSVGTIGAVAVSLLQAKRAVESEHVREKRTMKYEMDKQMPRLVFDKGENLIHIRGNSSFSIFNEGVGRARNISVKVNNNHHYINESINPGGRSSCSNDSIKDRGQSLDVSLCYEDVFDRKFETKGYKFKLNKNEKRYEIFDLTAGKFVYPNNC